MHRCTHQFGFYFQARLASSQARHDEITTELSRVSVEAERVQRYCTCSCISDCASKCTSVRTRARDAALIVSIHAAYHFHHCSRSLMASESENRRLECQAADAERDASNARELCDSAVFARKRAERRIDELELVRC